MPWSRADPGPECRYYTPRRKPSPASSRLPCELRHPHFVWMTGDSGDLRDGLSGGGQRHRMCGPGQIVPGPLLRRSHPRRAPTTPTAGIAPAAPLHMDLQSTVRLLLPLDPHDPESGQAENPRTIPLRSHASSLVGSTTRENDTGWSVPSGIALSTSRPPSRPPTPSAVRAGGRVLPQIAVVNRSFCHADSTEPDAQARCQTDGWRCGWVAQVAQSLR